MLEIVETYMNGNIAIAKQLMIDKQYTFAQVFECYIHAYEPDNDHLILFVNRLAK